MSNDVIDITDKVLANKSNIAENVYERITLCKENGEDCTCNYCTYRKKAANMMIDLLIRDVLTAEKNMRISFTSYDIKKIIYKMYDIIEERERDSIYQPIKGDVKDTE